MLFYHFFCADDKISDKVNDIKSLHISYEFRNNLKPIPNITISTVVLEGKNVIKVEAFGEDTPYSAYGRYYMGIDDSDIFMDSGQLWKYFELKRGIQPQQI